MVKIKNAETLKYLKNIDEYEDDNEACYALEEILEKLYGLRSFYAAGVYYGDYDVEGALKEQEENDRRYEKNCKLSPPIMRSLEDFQYAMKEAEYFCALETHDAKALMNLFELDEQTLNKLVELISEYEERGKCLSYDEITLWVEENKPKNSLPILKQATENISPLRDQINLDSAAVTCVAARPGMGKTSFLVHLALEYAQKNSKPVYIFSMKTSAEQFYNRMIISLAEVDEYEFRKNLLSEQDKEKIEIAKQNLSKMNLIIDDTLYFSIQEIEEKLENIADIGLVLLDSFQSLIHKRKPSDRKKIGSEITRRIHLLATRKNIPIVFTSNVSRKADRRKDKKPRLSDFHGTGVSTYYTDTICFIYREGYYFHLSKTDVAEFIIRKNKFGPCGKAILKWKYEFMKFYE